MATWEEFETAAPALAEKGRALIYQHGAPLGYLATVRPDGGPRLHPFCPVVAEGKLWAYVLKTSPKCGDLLRDGRYALHAFPAEEVDDEFMVRGRAVAVEPDDRLREAIVAAALPATVGGNGDEEQLFELLLDRVMTATYERRPQWPPTYDRWSAVV